MEETCKRALVLHGGGAAGNAWEIGIVAGLLDGGLDATKAELIIGTSAGATAAAQIISMSPAELFSAIQSDAPLQRTETPLQRTGPDNPESRRAPIGLVPNYWEITNEIIASAESAADMRRKMGAAALEAHAASDDAERTRWREVVAARLPSRHWPEQSLLITAVDAHTGEPAVFDRHSGVELVDAIAASTSNGFGFPPYRIGDKRYIDGGYRRNENADLAAGYARVLVLSPFGGRTRHPLEWGMQLATQIDELRAGGSRVETIFPDGHALSAFGGNMMDLSTRKPAALAGYNHGKALANELMEFWR